jgi:hypothetical protein
VAGTPQLEKIEARGTQVADASGDLIPEVVPAEPPFARVGGLGNRLEVQGGQSLTVTAVNNNPTGLGVHIEVNTLSPSELGPQGPFGGVLRPFGGSASWTASVFGPSPQRFEVLINVSGNLKADVFFDTVRLTQRPSILPR